MHAEAREFLRFRLVGEEKHVFFVCVQRVLLAQVQSTLEGAALAILVPDLDRLCHHTTELGAYRSGAGVYHLDAGVHGSRGTGGRQTDGLRHGQRGDGGVNALGAKDIVVLVGHDGELRKNRMRMRMNDINSTKK